MSHKRTDIREALKSLLIGSTGYATSAAERVYTNLTHNLPTDDLPAIIIRDGSESAISRDLRASQYIRTWPVSIEIISQASDNFDSGLDDICKQVEDLIASNKTLGGLTVGITYKGHEPTYDGSASQTLGLAKLNFDIQYIY